jgi:hypothetical protein
MAADVLPMQPVTNEYSLSDKEGWDVMYYVKGIVLPMKECEELIKLTSREFLYYIVDCFRNRPLVYNHETLVGRIYDCYYDSYSWDPMGIVIKAEIYEPSTVAANEKLVLQIQEQLNSNQLSLSVGLLQVQKEGLSKIFPGIDHYFKSNEVSLTLDPFVKKAKIIEVSTIKLNMASNLNTTPTPTPVTLPTTTPAPTTPPPAPEAPVFNSSELKLATKEDGTQEISWPVWEKPTIDKVPLKVVELKPEVAATMEPELLAAIKESPGLKQQLQFQKLNEQYEYGMKQWPIVKAMVHTDLGAAQFFVDLATDPKQAHCWGPVCALIQKNNELSETLAKEQKDHTEKDKVLQSVIQETNNTDLPPAARSTLNGAKRKFYSSTPINTTPTTDAAAKKQKLPEKMATGHPPVTPVAPVVNKIALNKSLNEPMEEDEPAKASSSNDRFNSKKFTSSWVR